MKKAISEYKKFLNSELITELNKKLEIKEKFINNFSKKELKNINIDDFVVGKGNKNSFCYILEYGDGKKLGSIKGGSANKFSLYYSKKYNDYIFDENKFSSPQNAIEKIRKELYKISNMEKYEEIEKSNLLKDVFKRKIFYMYNSEKIIPIFSDGVLSEKSKQVFGIEGDYNEIQKKLFEIYNEIDIENKNTYNFMIFIYKYFNDKTFLSKNVNEEIDIEKTLEVEDNNEEGDTNLRDKDYETKLDIQNREIDREKFELEKVSFKENIKMKKISFIIVMILIGFETFGVFYIFTLVGYEILKYSDTQLNIFILATITQITAIFFWIIKYLFPNKLNKN